MSIIESPCEKKVQSDDNEATIVAHNQENDNHADEDFNDAELSAIMDGYETQSSEKLLYEKKRDEEQMKQQIKKEEGGETDDEKSDDGNGNDNDAYITMKADIIENNIRELPRIRKSEVPLTSNNEDDEDNFGDVNDSDDTLDVTKHQENFKKNMKMINDLIQDSLTVDYGLTEDGANKERKCTYSKCINIIDENNDKQFLTGWCQHHLDIHQSIELEAVAKYDNYFTFTYICYHFDAYDFF